MKASSETGRFVGTRAGRGKWCEDVTKRSENWTRPSCTGFYLVFNRAVGGGQDPRVGGGGEETSELPSLFRSGSVGLLTVPPLEPHPTDVDSHRSASKTGPSIDRTKRGAKSDLTRRDPFIFSSSLPNGVRTIDSRSTFFWYTIDNDRDICSTKEEAWETETFLAVKPMAEKNIEAFLLFSLGYTGIYRVSFYFFSFSVVRQATLYSVDVDRQNVAKQKKWLEKWSRFTESNQWGKIIDLWALYAGRQNRLSASRWAAQRAHAASTDSLDPSSTLTRRFDLTKRPSARVPTPLTPAARLSPRVFTCNRLRSTPQ